MAKSNEYALHSDPKACWVKADQVTGGAVREIVYQKVSPKVDSSPFGTNLRNCYRKPSAIDAKNQWINRSFLCLMGLAA